MPVQLHSGAHTPETGRGTKVGLTYRGGFRPILGLTQTSPNWAWRPIVPPEGRAMQSSTEPGSYRRSSRVPYALPMLVTSLQPGLHFSEVCETMVVNAHGCSVRTPMKLEAGIAVHLHSKEGRDATAHVVDCRPIGSDERAWVVGAVLDQPENFWGLKPCPADWTLPLSDEKPGAGKANGKGNHKADMGLKLVSGARGEISDQRVREIVAESVLVMQSEISELRSKLAVEPAKRSSFEVSLSYIPPELEEKLWTRLRQDLGTQVLEYASEQSEKVLVDAKTAIAERLAETQEEFLQQAKDELEKVAVRGQRLSDDIDDGVRQQLHAGLETVQQNIVEAANRLERRCDEFYQQLKQRVGKEHETRLQEIEQVRLAITAESGRQQQLVDDLGQRVRKLSDTTSSMESELDSRLSRMSTEFLSATRTQLERDAAAILKELEGRNAAELNSQLDDACARLKAVQKSIEVAASELLRAKVAETLQAFQHSMQELAGDTVGRWRQALARDLGSVAKTLGSELRVEVSGKD